MSFLRTDLLIGWVTHPFSFRSAFSGEQAVHGSVLLFLSFFPAIWLIFFYHIFATLLLLSHRLSHFSLPSLFPSALFSWNMPPFAFIKSFSHFSSIISEYRQTSCSLEEWLMIIMIMMMKRVCALTMETIMLFQDFTASTTLNNNDLTCKCLFFLLCATVHTLAQFMQV